MDFLNTHLLSVIVFLPLAWAVVGMLIPAGMPSALRSWTLLGALVTFGLSALMYQGFSATGAEFQMTPSQSLAFEVDYRYLDYIRNVATSSTGTGFGQGSLSQSGKGQEVELDTNDLDIKMSGLMFGGRLESGVELGWIIPYVALNDDMFHAPAYSETALSGSPNFGLSFLSQNTNDPTVEAGFRQRAETGTARWHLAFTDQLAWVHNMSPVPAASAGYTALSGSAFTSFGARLPTNAGLFDLGVAAQNRDGFGVGLNFRSLLATDQQSYTGMGSLTYSW